MLSRLTLSPFVQVQIWRSSEVSESTQAAIVVANHISHLDPVLLSFAFQRPIDWMTTEEFYSNLFLGPLLHSLNTFPVDRSRPDHRALRAGIERLRMKRLVGIFPEGGLRAGPTSILGGAAPKSGATALARIAHVPIVPCIIFGSDRLYALRSWWPGRRSTRIWIGIGKPFVVSAKGEQANASLVEALREIGAKTSAHFRLSPDDLPQNPQRRKGREASSTS
jgi:1-acyl-sn-glycerol-3-phosphate acyltransferase